MLIAAVFLIAHPYAGIAHDAQLYVAQALNREHPGMLANDLLFRYGSQDRFTVFSVVFGPAVTLLGADVAASAFAAAGAGFGLWAAYRALRGAAPPLAALAGTIMLAAWPGWYGGFSVFGIVESFATPRVWATGLVLLAMAAARACRYGWSGGALLLALAFHPLIALPGVLWIALVAMRMWHAFIVIAVAALAATLAGAIGLSPFDRLFATFDPQWRQLVHARSEYLFATAWPSWDWDAAAGAILGSALVATRCSGFARRAGTVAAAIGALGLLTSVVGADWIGSVLVTQLQPWRALWIPTFVAGAGLGVLLWRLLSERDAEDFVAVAGLGAAVLLAPSASALPVVAAMIATVMYRRSNSERTRRLLLVAMALLLVQAGGWYLVNRENVFAGREFVNGYSTLMPRFLGDPLLLTAIALAGAAMWDRVGGAGSAAVGAQRAGLRLLLVGLTAVALGVGTADSFRVFARNAAQHRVLPEAAEIRARLPVGGNVFWRGIAPIPWLALGHPSYLSEIQPAAIVFSREMAIEADRRSRIVESVLGPRFFMRWTAPAGPVGEKHRELDARGAVVLCADPELAGVYVPETGSEVPGIAVRGDGGREIGRFVICADVRTLGNERGQNAG